MHDQIEAIRAAVSDGATADQKAHGAAACRARPSPIPEAAPVITATPPPNTARSLSMFMALLDRRLLFERYSLGDCRPGDITRSD